MTVFTPEYLTAMTNRWSATPENGQPLIVRIATDPDRDDDRERIEGWVDRLHPDDRSTMAARLQSKDHFITAYGELMTAQVLMSAGLAPRYEPTLKANGDPLTPDWVCDGTPALVCDAFTAGGAEDLDAHQTSLRDIEHRLKKLSHAATIRIEIADAAPLDAGARKRLVGEISRWLGTHPPAGQQFGQPLAQHAPEALVWYGSDMLVEMIVVGGKRLDVIVSDPMHVVTTPASVAANFESKAKRYGVLQQPILVAAVKHPDAEIDDTDVEDVLLGQLVFVSGETIDGRIVEGTGRLPHGVLPARPEISAALWVDPYSFPEPRVRVWANTHARYPLPSNLIEAISKAKL